MNYMDYYGTPLYGGVRSNFSSVDEGFMRGNIETKTYQGYKNYPVKMPVAKGPQQELKLEIQKYCFYCLDLGLFLDLNPNNSEVLQLYNECARRLKELELQYQSQYGAINKEGLTLTNEHHWGWLKNWPWGGNR